MKICKKGLHQYEPIKGNRPGCPGCNNARSKLWRENNLEKMKAAERGRSTAWNKANPERIKSSMLKRLYGIDLDQYNQMFAKQDGKCAICRVHREEFPKNFAVDHDHTTGKVRGLLCNRCNRGLGLLKESEENLTNAITYLRNNK